MMNPPLVLIIEDDKRQATIFSLALKNDFEVEVIEDGYTALSRLAQLSPAVVILDLHLPGISGEEILSYIRSQEHLTQTRVILATADAVLAQSLTEQTDLVLLKPISVSQLRQLARRLRPLKDTSS